MPTKMPARFTNADAARKHLEALLWPDGPVCPHCGIINEATALSGKSTRPGVYWCNACQKPFSVTVNTVYEGSKIPLNTWLYANHLLCSSKKGISGHQLARMLGVTYKTAWFLSHRIREAMREGGLMPPMGGNGGAVEVDETYIGRLKGQPKRRGGGTHKNTVLTLVERGGRARSFHVDGATIAQIAPIIRENISREARLMTDEANVYKKVGKEFASHDTVNHSAKEYGRGEVTTNTVEGFYSIFKRGMKGVYQRASEKHLHRYLAEFDFRYSNRVALGIDDVQRAELALLGVVGKRLKYQTTRGVETA